MTREQFNTLCNASFIRSIAGSMAISYAVRVGNKAAKSSRYVKTTSAREFLSDPTAETIAWATERGLVNVVMTNTYQLTEAGLAFVDETDAEGGWFDELRAMPLPSSPDDLTD